MKKRFLLVAFLFSLTKSFAAIFWQPYPIYATVAGPHGHQRVECQVFDSVLGSWQYYNTPFYIDSIELLDPVSEIIAFQTFSPPDYNDVDSIYGYIIYDVRQHLFKPVMGVCTILGFNSGNYYIDAGEGEFVYSDEFCCSSYGAYTYARQTHYDFFSHRWVNSPAFSSEGYLGDAYYIIGPGGFDWYGESAHNVNKIGGGGGPRAPFNLGTNGGYRTYLGGYAGNQDAFYIYGDGVWDTDIDINATEPDPQLNTGPLGSFPQLNILTLKNGILSFSDSIGWTYFAIYDDSMHQWAIDTIPFAIHNIKIKDRVVAYSSVNDTMLWYEAFSPTQRSWIKDSIPTSGITNLSIQHGTVTWTNFSGPQMRGYYNATGWGNFQTPLQLNFHISDFHSRTGYPVIFVRDYSIGTDSTWYEFDDGLVTRAGWQHSIYHLFKQSNGEYKPGGRTYTVCMFANDSSGIHSVCESRTPSCSFTLTKVSPCIGSCSGKAEVIPLSGTGPFTYSWSNGNTLQVADSLCFGTYSVTATDQNGCSVTQSVTFDTLQIFKTIQNITCHGLCNGIANAFPYGGTAPYTYSWSNGATTSSISNCCTGPYSVTVTDSNQCSATASYIFTQPTPMNFVNDISSFPTCNVPNGGSIDIWTGPQLNGTGPYSITYSPATGTIDNWNDSAFTIYSLTPGVYTIVVTDANGCSQTFVDTLPAPPPITSIQVTPVHPTCQGDCDGSFIPTITGGTPPYYYSYCSGGILPQGNLCPGVYCMLVRDAFYCTITDTFTLIDPPAFSVSFTDVDPSCTICWDGTIVLSMMGGIPPYSISWFPSVGTASGDSIKFMPAGIYTISVEDSNGCIIMLSDTLVAPPVGIESLRSEISFEIFPNPSSGVVTIICNSNYPESLSVENLLGQEIYSSEIKSKKAKIELRLSPGIYFVQVRKESSILTKRLIIQ